MSREDHASDSKENDASCRSAEDPQTFDDDCKVEEANSDNSPVASIVSLVRSTYLPNGATRVLEATLPNPFTEGGTLLFEPDSLKPDGLEMSEILVRQQNNWKCQKFW